MGFFPARIQRASLIKCLLLAAVFMCDTAHSADVTAPQLLEWDFTPKTVDVTTQAQRVTVTFRVTDDISGTETPNVVADSIDTTQSTGFANVQLISCNAIDGVWQAQLTIPAQSAPGQWKINLFPLRDVMGNSGNFGPGAGFPSELSVVSGTADVTAPQLLEWDFVPKTVDVTKQAQLVTVTFRVTDDMSGT